jgi:hypothetical protein
MIGMLLDHASQAAESTHSASFPGANCDICLTLVPLACLDAILIAPEWLLLLHILKWLTQILRIHRLLWVSKRQGRRLVKKISVLSKCSRWYLLAVRESSTNTILLCVHNKNRSVWEEEVDFKFGFQKKNITHTPFFQKSKCPLCAPFFISPPPQSLSLSTIL